MLILNKNKKAPYTLRDFMECDYPELLEATESGCTALTELQNALVELLPLSQKCCPVTLSNLPMLKHRQTSWFTSTTTRCLHLPTWFTTC